MSAKEDILELFPEAEQAWGVMRLTAWWPWVVGLFLLIPSSYANAQEEPVKIGVLAKRGGENALLRWTPTAQYLTAAVDGHDFIVVPLDFEGVYPAVTRQEVDFILANPGIFVDLAYRFGLRAIATLRNRRSQRSYSLFGGVVFVRADRQDIKDLRDLAGHTLMAVDPASLGGWLTAWRELTGLGIDPWTDLSEVRFAGTHDAVVYAVESGIVDAGVVRTDTLERMLLEGKVRDDSFRVLHASGVRHVADEKPDEFPFPHSTALYPEWPFAKLVHTDEALGSAVAVALLQMPPDSAAAQAAHIDGWDVARKYQPVHRLHPELSKDTKQHGGRNGSRYHCSLCNCPHPTPRRRGLSRASSSWVVASEYRA